MNRTFIRSIGFSAFLVIFMVGTAVAADFTAWNGIWFKANASETGFQAPFPPDGKPIVRNTRKTGGVFIEFESCDLGSGVCNLNICTFETTNQAWTPHPGVPVNILSGNALDFLFILSFTYTRLSGEELQLYLPLRIRGSVRAKAPGVIASASINSYGGYYIEEVDNPATGMGTGNVTLNGSLVPQARVATKVPADCMN